MQVYCSDEFLTALNKLTKPKFTNVYGSLTAEIAQFFKDYDTFDKVWNKSYVIRETQFIRINKVRLENPLQNSGTSGGFRLIVICDNRTQHIGLIYVYPKTGPHGTPNTPKDFLVKITKGYHQAKAAGKLKLYQP